MDKRQIKVQRQKKKKINVVGKVLDPKIIEKIIAKNRARKAIENQKILVNTMMSVA